MFPGGTERQQDAQHVRTRKSPRFTRARMMIESSEDPHYPASKGQQIAEHSTQALRSAQRRHDLVLQRIEADPARRDEGTSRTLDVGTLGDNPADAVQPAFGAMLLAVIIAA